VEQSLFISTLSVAYAGSGIVTFMGFIPTMRDLARGKPSANVSTYAVWTITTLMAFLYGVLVLRDMIFSVVIGLQLSACAMILILRIRLTLFSKRQ